MKSKKPYQKKKKRLGCGAGSGHGKTSTKGHKGQRARSGYKSRLGFEGGQNPLYRRLPKRGFSRADLQEKLEVVNVGQLDGVGEKEITPEALQKKGLVRKSAKGVKILGTGELKESLTVKAHAFSASAKTKIEAKGGQAVLIEI